ncbi:hypothetical protein glysoja_002424 [Glycine soja]|nr:hypothetical protein glysoja_002424 [Glycine soja]
MIPITWINHNFELVLPERYLRKRSTENHPSLSKHSLRCLTHDFLLSQIAATSKKKWSLIEL